MSNRRPVEPHYGGRAADGLPRSPAERLEPTRPAARVRRQRYDREPGGSWGLSRILSGLFTLLLVLMVATGGAALALHGWLNAPGPLARSKDVVIPKGEGSYEIATRLERERVISHRMLFVAGHRLYQMAAWVDDGRPMHLKAGTYQIPQAASVRHVIDLLTEGRTTTYRVTVPEGLTSHQIVERLKADPNLTGEIAEVPPEGALLPETFVVQRGSERQAIIDNLRAEAKKLAEKLWAQRRSDLPLRSWEEAVVLASIVEKETGRNDERERVAAVFINRLRKGMRLDSDPTIRYGLDLGKTVWNQPILKSEKAQKTPHNTYQIAGLPPTPICNPGKAAIEAVLNPADSKELFFVADGKGGHVFAETLKDHSVNVQKYRALEREKAAALEKEKAKAAAADTPATQPDKNAPPDKTKRASPGGGPWASKTEPAPDKSKP
jgi:UPF0755 protein